MTVTRPDSKTPLRRNPFSPGKNSIWVISSTDEWESDDDDDDGEWIDVHHSSEEEQEVSLTRSVY